MKKIMSVVLSVCMVVMMCVPAFAYSSSDAMKVQLSDQAMTEAVGGFGPYNVSITTATDGMVTGTISNSDINGPSSCTYKIWSGLNVQNKGGKIVKTGTVAGGTILNFSVPVLEGMYTRVTCENSAYPVLNAAAGALVE